MRTRIGGSRLAVSAALAVGLLGGWVASIRNRVGLHANQVGNPQFRAYERGASIFEQLPGQWGAR
jgi:hypothetical protein